jgi:hypothetical protein
VAKAKRTSPRPPGRKARPGALVHGSGGCLVVPWPLFSWVLVLPYLLVPLYAWKIRPVSTLMLAETLTPAAAMSGNGWILMTLPRCWCNR